MSSTVLGTLSKLFALSCFKSIGYAADISWGVTSLNHVADA